MCSVTNHDSVPCDPKHLGCKILNHFQLPVTGLPTCSHKHTQRWTCPYVGGAPMTSEHQAELPGGHPAVRSAHTDKGHPAALFRQFLPQLEKGLAQIF